MDIEYIKRFITVGQCLNFSKAAEALFISQPTLSHSIRCIEKELGTQLLARNTRSVNLTPAGELFLPAATAIVERYQDVVNQIYQELELGGDVLKIGYTGPVSDKLFGSWINKFCRACPDVKVQIQRYSAIQIGEAFADNQIHLGVLFKMNADKIPNLEYMEVDREKFKVVVSVSHPLAGRSSASLHAFADDPFLMCERSISPNYYDRVMEICERRNFKPNIAQVSGQARDIYHLVDAGLGIAIMSYSASNSYAAYNVKFIDFGDEADLSNGITIAWKEKPSAVACRFIDMVRDGASPS